MAVLRIQQVQVLLARAEEAVDNSTSTDSSQQSRRTNQNQASAISSVRAVAFIHRCHCRVRHPRRCVDTCCCDVQGLIASSHSKDCFRGCWGTKTVRRFARPCCSALVSDLWLAVASRCGKVFEVTDERGRVGDVQLSLCARAGPARSLLPSLSSPTIVPTSNC